MPSFCFCFRHGHRSVSRSSRDCHPMPLPSSEGCGPQDHVQRRSNVRWDERVGAWGRNYIGGDSISGSQKMRAHLTFFPFKPLPLTREWPASTNRNVSIPVSTSRSQNPTATSQNQHQHPRINPNPVPTSRNQPATTSRNQPTGTLEPSANISKLTETPRNQPRHLETHRLDPNANMSNLEPNINMSNTGIRPTPISQTQRQHLEPNANMSTMRIWTRPVSLVNGRIRFGRERMGRRNCITALMISITLPVSLLGLKEYICKYTIVIFFLFLVTHSLFQAMYEAMKCQYLCTPDIISCKTALQMFRQSTFDWYINVTIEFCVVSRAWKYTQFIAWTFAWLRTMNARLLLD